MRLYRSQFPYLRFRSVCATYNTHLRLAGSNCEDNVRFAFRINGWYSRKDVLKEVSLPDPAGGNWYTGYASHGEDFFIFCNVGTTGRTGHDYQNRWEGEDLIWFAKNGSHVGQPAMQRLLDGSRDVYVFWRSDNEGPFTFAGLARPTRVTTTSPVRVRWRFSGDVA
jgi:5-methylcytosine-specific restriction enzyme A